MEHAEWWWAGVRFRGKFENEDLRNEYWNMGKEILRLKEENGSLRKTVTDLQHRRMTDNWTIAGISEVLGEDVEEQVKTFCAAIYWLVVRYTINAVLKLNECLRLQWESFSFFLSCVFCWIGFDFLALIFIFLFSFLQSIVLRCSDCITYAL